MLWWKMLWNHDFCNISYSCVYTTILVLIYDSINIETSIYKITSLFIETQTTNDGPGTAVSE